ncbi:hypothetical protein CANTEDRAFT_135342 [Yamadazyma tenuis ATCC 10573]|uniref:Uncharacterized protein n=2 Tax=Candida tenuis TaxID=2315449 RepID=G3BA79_CANTC|nr:uncharacterized protein CANTEDRAFT_135342 [Yamadazyma tenuis ATCC 10573]EGV61380.1 hypothetical protein CANTEDRAFT_135342 [Yamadazyma tenuis ATCC 10573]
MTDQLAKRGYTKLLLNLSAGYRIDDLEDIFKFFNVEDEQYESACAMYHTLSFQQVKWPEVRFTEEGMQSLMVDLFNLKFSQYVQDDQIYDFVTPHVIQKYLMEPSPDISAIRLSSYIPIPKPSHPTVYDWDQILMKVYLRSKYPKRAKEFFIKYMDQMAIRNREMSRPGENFENFYRVVLMLQTNLDELMKTSSEVIVLLSKLWSCFQFEIQYWTVFDDQFKEFSKFKDICDSTLYSSPLVMWGYHLPDEWVDFLEELVSVVENSKDALKVGFLSDLQAFVGWKDPVEVEELGPDDTTAIRRELMDDQVLQPFYKRYSWQNSKYWDKYCTDSLFYLVYSSADHVEGSLSPAITRYYFRHLRHELLEYLNLFPAVVTFVVMELKDDNPHWDVEYLKSEILVLAAYLLAGSGSTTKLFTRMCTYFNTFNYPGYIAGRVNVEEEMVQMLGDYAVEAADELVRYADQMCMEKQGVVDVRIRVRTVPFRSQ